MIRKSSEIDEVDDLEGEVVEGEVVEDLVEEMDCFGDEVECLINEVESFGNNGVARSVNDDMGV